MSGNFDSTKRALEDLLREVNNGKLQLPDFQRGWVWDDEHIKSLLASISMAFPVGTIMLLETGNEKVKFKPRPVEGVNSATLDKPESLILDGQQRLTSLYQAIYSGKVVETRDIRRKTTKRWYYIDIDKALDSSADREEAIISLPEDRQLKNFRGEVESDYSTPEREYEARLFPIAKLFDSSNWRMGYEGYWKYDSNEIKRFNEFERKVIQNFQRYQVPIIKLMRDTPKEAVCLIFEKVNTGGVSLNVFELLTATYAAEDFNLRDDWKEREQRFRENSQWARILQMCKVMTFYKGLLC